MDELDEPVPVESGVWGRDMQRLDNLDPPIPPREAIAEVRVRAPTGVTGGSSGSSRPSMPTPT